MRKARAIPLPRLLNENMREVCRLHPSVFSAVVKLTPLSTASITLPDGEPVLMSRQWVEVFGPYGTLGIYRVSKPRRVYGQQQQAIMEHGIATLGDDLTPKETTLMGTIRGIMQTLLGYQSARRWALGEAPDTGSYTLDVNRTKVLEAVLDLLKQAPEYALAFDQTSTPWRVSIKALSASPMCECRLSRNTSNVAETLDDSSLLTRVYSAALPGGYMDGPTVGTWGVVAEDLGVADDAEQAKAEAYAQELLESRKNPAVSLEVDGLYLARITGEPLDALRVGALCRVALPRYGMTADERILECRFPDLLNAPERVRLTLSSQPKDTSRTLADLRNSANSLTHTTLDQGEMIRSHGGSISQLKVELEKTYEYAEIVNGNLTEFENYVGIQLDEQNVAISLKASQEAVDKLGTRVSSAEIKIDGANAAIETKASQAEVDKFGQRLGAAEATLTVQAGEIASKVSKNGVISSINQTAEEVSIQASKINLSGYVTVDELEAINASITNLTTGGTTAQVISTVGLHVANGFTFRHRIVDSRPLTVGTKRFTVLSTNDEQPGSIVYSDLPHYHAISASADNSGNINLTLGAAQATEGTANFNIADTQFYKDGVSAAKESVGIRGSWNDSIFTATTTGQVTAHTVSTELSEITTNGDPAKNGKFLVIPCKVTTMDDAVVLTDNVTASAASVYDDGYAAGVDEFSLTTITLQGSAHANITPIGMASRYTYSTLYQAGSSHTYYKGNGDYVTGRGSSVSVTPIGRAVHFKRHGSSEKPTGTWYTITSSGYDLTYYTPGTETKYYQGNGTGGYLRGDSVDIASQGVATKAYVTDPNGSVTMYSAGAVVTGLYNAGSQVDDTYYVRAST